jgi:hypothetical protein
MECWRAHQAAGQRYALIDAPYWLARKWSAARITWNAFHYTGGGPRRRGDLAEAGCVIERQRQPGSTIYLCPQHRITHRELFGETDGEWLERTAHELLRHTDRPIVIRRKEDDGVPYHDLNGRIAGMRRVLADAWAVVTPASSIAVEAVCRGVPVFVDPLCAAAAVGDTDLSRIEAPRRPDRDEVREWAQALAARQFGVGELEDGRAWRALCEDWEHLEEQWETSG